MTKVIFDKKILLAIVAIAATFLSLIFYFVSQKQPLLRIFKSEANRLTKMLLNIRKSDFILKSLT